MMGGDGTNVDDTELSDLHLSAICEAMNQMMGSAATSMSSMINEKVDISPPTATRVDFGEGLDEAALGDLSGQLFAQVSFRMEIGDLVDSEIMQLYPIEFARLIYQQFVGKTWCTAIYLLSIYILVSLNYSLLFYVFLYFCTRYNHKPRKE